MRCVGTRSVVIVAIVGFVVSGVGILRDSSAIASDEVVEEAVVDSGAWPDGPPCTSPSFGECGSPRPAVVVAGTPLPPRDRCTPADRVLTREPRSATCLDF